MILYYIILYHITSYYTILYCTMLYYDITIFYDILYYTMYSFSTEQPALDPQTRRKKSRPHLDGAIFRAQKKQAEMGILVV